MGPAQLQALPVLPPTRVCTCGNPLALSHVEYLGRGESVPIHRCRGCGLLYRGAPGAGGRQPPRRSRKPLPDGGHPENPVLASDVADRLRELLDRG